MPSLLYNKSLYILESTNLALEHNREFKNWLKNTKDGLFNKNIWVQMVSHLDMTKLDLYYVSYIQLNPDRSNI